MLRYQASGWPRSGSSKAGLRPSVSQITGSDGGGASGLVSGANRTDTDAQRTRQQSPRWLDLRRGAEVQTSQPLTWLGHRPLFALKQAAGRRQLADTCPVCGPGTELIEVAFAKVADLEEQRHRLNTEAGEEGAEVQRWGGGGERKSVGALNRTGQVGLHLQVSWIMEAREPPTGVPPYKSGPRVGGHIPALPCRPGWGQAAG